MKPLIATAIALFAISAQANDIVSYTQARVVNVEPITSRSFSTVPRRSCTMIEEYRGDGHAAVTGAVIGGAIGRNVAKDKDVGTVVGAVVGSAIATEHARPGVRMVERCSTYHDREFYDRISGYNVTFEFNGQLRTVRFNHDPGTTVRVKTVTKVYAVE